MSANIDITDEIKIDDTFHTMEEAKKIISYKTNIYLENMYPQEHIK